MDRFHVGPFHSLLIAQAMDIDPMSGRQLAQKLVNEGLLEQIQTIIEQSR